MDNEFDDVIDEELDDVGGEEDAEFDDEDGLEDGDVEGDEDADGDEDGGEGDNSDEDSKAKQKNTQSKFTAEQQKTVDNIVKTRLERQSAQQVRQLSQVAGVELSSDEIVGSAKLWGLLKANPELSEAVDLIIAQQLQSGKAKEPMSSDHLRESKLEVKEAILDLKLEDALFRKNSDRILEWAEDQGYAVDSAKALKLAFMAWKGSKEAQLAQVKKASEQKRKDAKQATQKRAGVQSSSSSKTPTKVNYQKMSDLDILAKSGMKLFLDD